MDDVPLSYNFLLIILLLLLSGFFSTSEGALFSLGRHQRERLRKEGRKSSKLIEKLLHEPYKLIITILFADEVVNVAYTSVIGLTVNEFLQGYSENFITILSIAIASPSLLLLGEIGPKTLGVKYPRIIAGIISYPLHLFHLLITPVRWVLVILSIGFTRVLGGKIEYEHSKEFTPEEVKVLVGLGSEEGVITDIEKKLVGSLFKLEEVPAYKIMTPSIDCFLLPANLSRKDAVYEIKKRGFSRTPVYEGDKDNIIGVLYAKDLLSYDLADDTILKNILKPPYFIPRTKMAFDLLKELQHERKHIAIVVDEYGRFDGLVTMEDILEELFGEIEDERRVVKQPQVRWDGESLIIPGSMKIEEFNDTFLFTVLRFGGLENLGDELEQSILPAQEDHETVAGFIFDMFGKFPDEGDSVSHGSLVFLVNKVSGKRITEIKVQRMREEVAVVA
ncbi:MAG: hemolysin family protein [Thermodesulfobacteriota bacterium]